MNCLVFVLLYLLLPTAAYRVFFRWTHIVWLSVLLTALVWIVSMYCFNIGLEVLLRRLKRGERHEAVRGE
jgi:uncharacterized BrkB/YihY/UPF0761 family membrane protein